MQIALGLMWIARQVNKYGETVRKIDLDSLDRKAVRAVVLCFIAEFFCNHGMITGNHFMNVIETTLWNIALGGLIPDTFKLYQIVGQVETFTEIDASQAKRFVLFCLICFIIFVT